MELFSLLVVQTTWHFWKKNNANNLDDFSELHIQRISKESAAGVENTNILKNNCLDSDSANETISWSEHQLLAKTRTWFLWKEMWTQYENVGLAHCTME